ncbi:hypothetical protein Zmor_019887 [Zophobas morio]|uniref:Uncharacterized protein n=1 Tax=Zophobas morio TaxID=2755281 RepID=A0AA38M9D6_9CUCU|nr:hypothetical protein Zmor_019887 [Zophobas morio]
MASRRFVKNLGKINFNNDDSSKVRLDRLLSFLRKEVESEERVALTVSGFGEKFLSKDSPKDVLTATSLLRCLFCYETHYNSEGPEAKKKSLIELKKILSEKGRCHACLKFGKTTC